MNQIINFSLEWMNNVGQWFWDYSAGMFIQVSLLIIVLLAVDFLFRKRVRAVFRYCVWMLVFVKLILPPTLSLPTGIGYWYGDYLSAESPVLQEVSSVVRPEPVMAPTPENFAPSTENPQVSSSETISETTAPVTSAVSGLNALTWQAVVFGLWLVGVLVISVLLIQRMLFVKGLVAQSEPAKNRLPDMLNQCRRQVGIRRNIELRLSNNISGPAVCGLFKPVILIPTALLEKLSPDRLRAVLIHELVHIKRADIWVNLVQTVLQIIYFYNPFVWLANAVVRSTREQAVDEMVLVALGAGAKSYSNTLIDIAEMAFWKTSLSLRLIGVVESKKALHRRIRHMLNRPIPKNAKLSVVSVFAIIVAGIVLLPMARGERKLRNPVRLDENGRPIITHTLYMWGQVEDPVYQLEGKIYHEVDKVVSRIGELMKQDPFPMIRVRTTSKFQRQQEPIENFGKCCRDIGFINIEYKYDLSIPIGTFQAILHNGVTVELVGICEHPSEGKQWWQPDGQIIKNDLRPYASKELRSLRLPLNQQENKILELAVKITDSSNRNVGMICSGANRTFVNCRNNVWGGTVEIDKELDVNDFKIGVAVGAWETLTSSASKFGSRRRKTPGIVFTEAYNTQKGYAVVTVTHKKDIRKENWRVVAIDQEGKPHKADLYQTQGIGEFEQNMFHFKGLRSDQIRRFEFQTRPYQWVIFNNVSLKPGIKTDVQIEVEKSDVLRVPSDKYPTIQSAVNAAKDSDTIVVKSDVYEQNKVQITLRASVFSVRTPPSSITNFLHNELGLKNTPVINLTDAQAEQFKKLMESIPNTTTVTSPTAIVFDRQPADLSVTTQHEYTVDYEESAESPAGYKPKRKKFTTGVQLNLTPELKQNKNLIILTLKLKKTDLVKLKSKLHPSGNQVQLPVFQTAETRNTIAVQQGKYLLALLSGMSSRSNSSQPDKPVQQTILLVKADVPVEVEKH